MAVFKWGISGEKTTDPREFDPSTLLSPAVRVVLLPTDGSTFDPPRFFLGDQPGTATVTDATGGAVANFPITGGEQHLAITAIQALQTTTKVWGCY